MTSISGCSPQSQEETTKREFIFEGAGRNPFLPDQQAGQSRQERIPYDARKHLTNSDALSVAVVLEKAGRDSFLGGSNGNKSKIKGRCLTATA
jgi:hypothetical protein